MSRQSAFVGVDAGTTGVKAVAYTPDGRALAQGGREYALRAPRPGTAGQDPREIFEASLDRLSGVIRETAEGGAEVSTITLSAAMYTLVGPDEAGRPITPSLTFADSRAAWQAEKIKQEMDGDGIHGRTGTPVHPMAPLPKLLWFKEEKPEVFRRAARWASTVTIVGLVGFCTAPLISLLLS